MIIKIERESPAETHRLDHDTTNETRTQVVLEFGLFVRINLIAKRPCYPVTCQRTFRKSEGTRLMSNGSNRFTEPMRTRQASMADGEVLRKLESNSLRVSELRAEILKRNGRTRDDANRALRKEELINELRSLLQVSSIEHNAFAAATAKATTTGMRSWLRFCKEYEMKPILDFGKGSDAERETKKLTNFLHSEMMRTNTVGKVEQI